MGTLKITDQEPKQSEFLSVFFRVSKGKSTYPAVSKNGLKSRKRLAFEGHSIKYEFVKYIDVYAGKEEENTLAEIIDNQPLGTYTKSLSRKDPTRVKFSKLDFASKLTQIGVKFDLCNELSISYDLALIMDQGKYKTSRKMDRQVLVFETARKRY